MECHPGYHSDYKMSDTGTTTGKYCMFDDSPCALPAC